MLQFIWNLVSLLTGLALVVFISSIVVLYIVFFIQELKKAAKK